MLAGLISSASDIAIQIFRWAVRLGFVAAIAFALFVILNMVISMLGVVLNQSVLNDIFALVQLWLPFNLSVLLSWLFTAVVAYFTYRLAVLALNLIEKLIP